MPNTKMISYLRDKPIIALVGATNDSQKYGNIILRDMAAKGFRVVPVNSRAHTVEGIEAFPTLETAKSRHEIGLVVYVIPPRHTLQSLAEAASLGLKRVWVQPGAGDEAVRDYLENNNFDYVMDLCVMVESGSVWS
jgi:hypothetical protein